MKSPSTYDCICRDNNCVGLPLPLPLPKPEQGAAKTIPMEIPNKNSIFPSPTLSSLRENYPVRRKFPRTWIWEEINMRFTYMNYLLQYL